MEQNQSVDSSTAVVTEMLTSAINPLVAITVIPKVLLTQFEMGLQRAMGFVIQRLRGNLRLVVTCRHVFPPSVQDHHLIYTMKNPKPTAVKAVSEPIFDPNPESDVAFVIIRDPQNARSRPFALQAADIPLPHQCILYNARNVTESTACEFFIARQPVRETNEWAFTKFSDPYVTHVPLDDETEQQQLLADGWIRCRSLHMVSRQGYSGSPVWDDDLRLHGMNIRGSEPGTEHHDNFGDIMIFVPTSEIYLARQRADDQIQRVLNSI